MVASGQVFVIIDSSKLTLQLCKVGKTSNSETFFLASSKWIAKTPWTNKNQIGNKHKNANHLISRYTSVLIQFDTSQFNT